MAQVIMGADVAAVLREEIAKDLADLNGYVPRIAVVRVGEREDDIAYEKGVISRTGKLGLRCTTHQFPADISNEDFQQEFKKINDDSDVDGILLFRPLPKQIDEKAIGLMIDVNKDVDCMSPLNLAKVFIGDKDAYDPCTAEAVMRTLDYAGIELRGKRVTVVGRSMVVGKPLSMMLLGKNATVTICHTKTADFVGTCRNAEVLIAAAGHAGLIRKEHVADGAAVIDVAINVDENGKLCGDVVFDEVSEVAGIITPVPRGVGSVTTLVLLKHLTRSAKRKFNLSED